MKRKGVWEVLTQVAGVGRVRRDVKDMISICVNLTSVWWGGGKIGGRFIH